MILLKRFLSQQMVTNRTESLRNLVFCHGHKQKYTINGHICLAFAKDRH